MTNLLREYAWGWNHEANNTSHFKRSDDTSTTVGPPRFFLQPFILESDASGTGMSAILMQRGRSIAYLSDALHGCNIIPCPPMRKKFWPLSLPSKNCVPIC